MEIFEGTRLLFPRSLNQSNRITINSGVIRKIIENDHEVRAIYEPRNDWRTIKNTELSSLLFIDNTKCNYKSEIGIFSLPESIKSLGTEMKLFECKSLADIQEVINRNESYFKRFQVEIVSFIKRFVLVKSLENETSIQGFYFAQPGQATVAVDRSKQTIGLHIDFSVESHTLSIKNTVNRLTVNVGSESRYFLFVNLTIDKLIDRIKVYEDRDFRAGYESLDLPGIVDKFFQLYPDYPIIRLRQDPYEGYIAPTDSIIHDGSTVDMKTHDITLNFLGHFATSVDSESV